MSVPDAESINIFSKHHNKSWAIQCLTYSEYCKPFKYVLSFMNIRKIEEAIVSKAYRGAVSRALHCKPLYFLRLKRSRAALPLKVFHSH